jgi:DNA-directed RNA polymerase subunit RPC12/RpoP
MKLFSYLCLDCGKKTDVRTDLSSLGDLMEANSREVYRSCPKCGSLRVKKQMSFFRSLLNAWTTYNYI